MFKRARRLLRHLWMDDGDLRRALPPAALSRLAQQIKVSEQRHSGEIRIHAEPGLPWSYLRRDASPRERALTLFGKLSVWDTEQNNGVLIYLLLADNAIEIVADRGLNRHVDAQAWRVLVAQMGLAFRAGRFEEGLAEAVQEISALLEQHYAVQAGQDNPNELPDAPVMGGRH